MEPTQPVTTGPTLPSTQPPPADGAAQHRPPPLPQLVMELRDLVVSYFKQQTLIPLQKLVRYIGFGLLGSLLMGFGVLFLGVSLLRVLQTETEDTFVGDWSWAPYLITFVVLLLGGALVWLARTARRADKESR